MAYSKSAEQIYQEMITNLKEDVDTSSKSLIYSSNMPVAMELAYQTLVQDELLKRIHGKTALENGYDEDVILLCKDMGIERKSEEYAHGTIKVHGIAGATIPVGAIVGCNAYKTYTTDSELILDTNGDGWVSVTATAPGTYYNCNANEITVMPVKYTGIESITNENEFSNGYDIESIEDLFARYQERVTTIVTSGNLNYYKLLLENITGVGAVKGYETTNEDKETQADHALFVITSSSRRAADTELLTKAREVIEANRFIGAHIHVISAEELIINVSFEVDFDSSETDLNIIETQATEKIENYFNTFDFNNEYVSVGKIESIIFGIPGVNDVVAKLNNATDNIPLTGDKIAVLGTVTATQKV